MWKLFRHRRMFWVTMMIGVFLMGSLPAAAESPPSDRMIDRLDTTHEWTGTVVFRSLEGGFLALQRDCDVWVLFSPSSESSRKLWENMGKEVTVWGTANHDPNIYMHPAIHVRAVFGPGDPRPMIAFPGYPCPVETKLIDFERPATDEIPEAIAQWRQRLHKFQGIYRMHHEGRTWLLVAWGEKPTGGYGVQITEARRSTSGAIDFTVDLTAPRPGDIVPQVLTYPHDLVVLDETDAKFAFRFEGAPWKMKPLPPPRFVR